MHRRVLPFTYHAVSSLQKRPAANPASRHGAAELSYKPSPMADEQRRPHSFQFINCSYVVPIKGPNKTKTFKALVNCTSGTVQSGGVLAILGPSGAGKTTLLNMLALEDLPGICYGTIELNTIRFTPLMYRRYAAYVPQTDTLWSVLTCREHLEYATRLYQPLCHNVQEQVDSMLNHLGLHSCQHVKAGNAIIKGLSGGQKRRLSLGVALSKEPCVVFLDEPTTGLDSAAAASILKFLRDSAPLLGTAILCTIHQPSTSVFEGFDQVCFMTGGKICYAGPAKELADYLDWAGFTVPDHANAADFMLDLTNRDFGDGGKVDNLLSLWRQHAPPLQHALHVRLDRPHLMGGRCRVFWMLARRYLRLVLRDPLHYSARCVLTVVQNCYTATLFVYSRNTDQEQATKPCLCPPEDAFVTTYRPPRVRLASAA